MRKLLGKTRSAMVRRLSAALLSAVAVGAILAPAQQTYAAGTTCTTIHVDGGLVTAIRPHMDVPICYNGSQVWQNGNITPGVDTYVYTLDSISWYGSYGGGGWLGVGENYTVNWGGWATFSCASRWGVNASGNVISFDRGC